MLATVDRRDRRLHNQQRDVADYDVYRVYYRLEDDFLIPTFCTMTAYAKTERDAARAVDEEIDGSIPLYSEEMELGEIESFRDILEIHGYDPVW
jgi:hypothetical protein